jgi:hypothetical protein
MASNAQIFFAGVGTTFAILGAGFGGGAFMANSALKEPTHQTRAAEQPSPMRVILPASAEAAQAPQLQTQHIAAVETEPAKAEPVKAEPVKTAPEKRIEKIDSRKAEKQVRERRKRYADRKAKREAARARQQAEPREEPAIMAFGRDEPRQSFNLFGN